eukprot:gb/GECG01009040.1/.p1 GENE.gb/GECG01009040.1/~~gb/GECG01009040.1/.p1  ORF type:complete len:437 (+),score=74.67 gb/GECG01009040.1/:1-1311(+)
MADRDPAFEYEALRWIEDITGESAGGDFQEGLQDGVLLCQLINKISPGSVRKINKPPTMPFKKMENITKYLKAVRKFGVDEYELFSTNDLYEAKNLKQVAYHIHALGRTCQDKHDNDPNFTWPSEWPTLGIKLAKKNERKFSEAQIRRAKNTPSALNMGSSKMGREAAEDVLEGRISEKLKQEKQYYSSQKNGDSAEASAQSTEADDKKAAAKEEWRVKQQSQKAETENESKKTEEAAQGSSAASNTASSGQSTSVESKKPKRVVKEERESLPPGWKAAETEDGTKYYFNPSTGVTQWEKPEPAAPKKPTEENLPSGWRSATTEDGSVYYFNKSTGERSWTPPTGQSTSATSSNVKTPDEDPELAEGWRAVQTDDGREYYFNKSTRETRWEKPLRKPKVVADETLPHPWRAVVTPDGQTYYHNKETNQTQWEKPNA